MNKPRPVRLPPPPQPRFVRGLKVGFLATAMALSANATAGDLSVTLPIGCKHFKKSYDTTDYNEQNFGLGLEYEKFGVLAYDNSYNKLSVAAYYNAELTLVDNALSVGARVGAITGYENVTGYKVTPIAQPYMSIMFDDHKFNVGVLPTGLVSHSSVKAVITLDYQYKF